MQMRFIFDWCTFVYVCCCSVSAVNATEKKISLNLIKLVTHILNQMTGNWPDRLTLRFFYINFNQQPICNCTPSFIVVANWHTDEDILTKNDDLIYISFVILRFVFNAIQRDFVSACNVRFRLVSIRSCHLFV